MAISFMEGNEALARGALAAGCTFFAGYPITPATSVLNHMLKMLPPAGGVCIQGEDEIASMGYCLGASMAGKKTFTATSGPGISLYSEQISFAIGSEIPVVIADIQRLGPSTGSATRGADSDIQFLRWGSTCGLPVIVLAPRDALDCYVLAVHAFNFAEEFRCPVFIASNKETGLTRESIDLDSVTLPPIVERRYFKGNEKFQPFAAAPDKPPPFLPIGGNTIVRQTSSTHGPDGYITIDPELIEANVSRLAEKINSAKDRLTLFDKNIEKNTDTLILSYGVTSRAVNDAAKILKSNGRPVSTLSLQTLWPVPEVLLKAIAEQVKTIIVVEMNHGLYLREIKRVLPDKKIRFIGQMNGTLIPPDKITEAIENERFSE